MNCVDVGFINRMRTGLKPLPSLLAVAAPYAARRGRMSAKSDVLMVLLDVALLSLLGRGSAVQYNYTRGFIWFMISLSVRCAHRRLARLGSQIMVPRGADRAALSSALTEVDL